MTSSQEDSPQPDYFSTKNNVLSVILQGYTSLPSLYHPDFVDPLKKIFSDDYQAIIESINQNKNSPDPDLRRHPDYPFRRWIDDIYQRITNYKKEASNAFEESVSDSGLLDELKTLVSQKLLEHTNDAYYL